MHNEITSNSRSRHKHPQNSWLEGTRRRGRTDSKKCARETSGVDKRRRPRFAESLGGTSVARTTPAASKTFSGNGADTTTKTYGSTSSPALCEELSSYLLSTTAGAQ